MMVSLLTAAASARANSYIWINLNGGNWGVAGNWSPNGIPGGSDSAAITMTGNYTVTVNSNQSIGTLRWGRRVGTGRCRR